MEKQYLPAAVEQKIYEEWERCGYFKADAKSHKTAFSIVIPPPNVTGILHMGHALNNTIQDILTRYKRMDGFEALWIPGTDHAGIATQNVVEKKLAKEGNSRHKLGREKFIEKVWQWKAQYHATISKQLRKLGSSCDWSRERFTMDEGLSKAVRKVFVKLYEDGLIYRGKYIVNWCPRCRTALADDEVEHQDESGNLWHFRYPFADKSGYVTVATTRPETMLGDVGVAVNPKDERYKNLVGKKLILPIVNREIPLICDDYVSKEFGTGAVKITPAHDPNDFQMGLRHNLQVIVVMDEAGKMAGEIPAEYAGLDRFEARKKIVGKFEELGLLEKVEKHDHAVGHCYRCATTVEPYYSDQWFVKMRPLADLALEAALKDELKFYPVRWRKTYIDWMENIRDWCISRQIWWGHRIPVWYCDKCGEIVVSETDPTACPKCESANLRQESDVLDTWFSSWLWPFTTMNWSGDLDTDDLKKFFPTSVLSTAPDIIFFWVARMVMASLYFTGKVPFAGVIFHGTVRDKTGKKMSKSLGNAIDPLEIIATHGADSLRFSMIMNTAAGTDIFIGEDSFDIGRNFANKLWNAARFLITNIENGSDGNCLKYDCLPPKNELKAEDNWIISRLNQTVENVRKSLDQYKFNEASHTLYDFIWKDFCDWYIEAKKSDFYKPKTPKDRENALNCASYVLASLLKLLHPFMPFVTEEVWRHLRAKVKNCAIDNDSIMLASFPKTDFARILPKEDADFAFLQEIITGLRTIRSENNVAPEKKVAVVIIPSDENAQNLLSSLDYLIKLFVKCDELTISREAQKPQFAGQSVVAKSQIFVCLEGLVDIEGEKEKINKEIIRLQNAAAGFENRLNNAEFTSKAPQKVIEAEKAKYANVLETLEKLRASLKELG